MTWPVNRAYGRRIGTNPQSIDYLNGLELDIALSDYSGDLVEPAEREAMVVTLPELTAAERKQIRDEQQR